MSYTSESSSPARQVFLATRRRDGGGSFNTLVGAVTSKSGSIKTDGNTGTVGAVLDALLAAKALAERLCATALALAVRVALALNLRLISVRLPKTDKQQPEGFQRLKESRRNVNAPIWHWTRRQWRDYGHCIELILNLLRASFDCRQLG